MPTLGEVLADAAERLRPVTETPRLDAEILLAHALGESRTQVLAALQQTRDVGAFQSLLERRLTHEPLAYILGKWEFFSLEFLCAPPVLVPRPETEHLVEVVLEEVGESEANVLDVGTGTGCVAIAAAHNAPRCRVTATDVSPAALALATRNVALHELDQRVVLMVGDLFEAVGETGRGRFDVICSNPPYIAEGDWDTLAPVIQLYEDRAALLAGEDGLDVVRRLIAEAMPYLRPGGLLAFEIGMGQYEAVEALLCAGGYRSVGMRRDLAGIERVATGKRPEGTLDG